MQLWSLSLGLLLLCLVSAAQAGKSDYDRKGNHNFGTKKPCKKGQEEGQRHAPTPQGKRQDSKEKDDHQEGDRYCAESREDIEEYLENNEDNIGAEVQLCYSGCCRDRCCDWEEKETFWKCTRKGWEKKHGKGHGDDDRKTHHAYKIVAIVLSAVFGVFIILSVTMICYKKKVLKRQGSVAASTRNEKMKKYISHDTQQRKDGPMPDVETMKMPPAYYIADVPPPMYISDPNQPLPDSLPTAPPSYSTINIQEAAGGIVVVQPAKEA